MNTKRWLGLGILGMVAVVTVVATQINWEGLRQEHIDTPDPVTVSLFYGGEKTAFLDNPAVIERFERRYGVTLDAHKAGSIEMVTSLDTAGKDCLWPSNQIAVELARQRPGQSVLSDQNIFNSPIVFYAWDQVAQALIDAGIAEDRGNAIYVVYVDQLIDMILAGKRWKEDLGVNVYGPVKVFSTDPRKSNSGNMWSGLLATVINGGRVVTADDLDRVLPEVRDYFQSMGHMEHSSGDIFENFLSQGMGARPIIVGYENQLAEFVLAHPDRADDIRDRIRVLYPEPTVFSSHPLISLTPACKRLEEALTDPEVQDIAWRQHGFRSGLIGVQNDPSVLEITGIPTSIDIVVPMPRAAEMRTIIGALN